MKNIIIIFLITLSSNLFATDYFIKIGGNNALAGTSDALAWGDLSKVNSVFSLSVARNNLTPLAKSMI